jgi:hypothetical protein
MTKGELFAAMDELPDDTHLEICVKYEDGSSADFEVGAVGVVVGDPMPSPPWFNIQIGEFICDCG